MSLFSMRGAGHICVMVKVWPRRGMGTGSDQEGMTIVGPISEIIFLLIPYNRNLIDH